MNKTRLLVLLLALIMVVSVFAGCQPETEDEAIVATDAPAVEDDVEAVTDEPEATEEVPLEEYTIQAYFPGDTPIDFDIVLAAVEEKASDLNVILDFKFVPWSDYSDKVMTKISAGEDFDLHLNAPWMHMQQLIAAEAVQPWDDLIAKYGPNIVKEFETPIEFNKFEGKIYGIPLIDRLGAYSLVNSYRGDLCE